MFYLIYLLMLTDEFIACEINLGLLAGASYYREFIINGYTDASETKSFFFVQNVSYYFLTVLN